MPTESPNTLRSRAKIKTIDLIGIGQIGGLYNGAKSVYFDETPVMNEDGTLNFPNFDVTKDLQQLLGEATQDHLPGFPASESEISVGVKVTKDSPEGSGSGDGSVTRTITDSDVDAAVVIIRVPALSYTNTTTGDIYGSKIQFQISVQESGGSYIPISAGQAWSNLAIPTNETPDETTGLDLTVSSSTEGTLIFEYRKKTLGVWGSWTSYGETIISKFQAKATRDYTKNITNLEPGIYQARAQINSVVQTATNLDYLGSSVIEIEGKTTSAYDAAYRVPLPAGGEPWNIKVSRISEDNTDANIQDDLYWYSYKEVIDNKFSMPNCAAIGVNINAEDFGGKAPERAYEVVGRNTIKIPDNYDPITKTYTGVWTGTFTEGWTDNPAWIFYDLLTNKLYGLGDNISEDQIDKYGLYEIAQYCDELVDAQDGTQEPRYTINTVINSQSEAYELLNSIASAFRGMIYWASGSISAVADKPTDPTIDVGPANVIDGIFTYQGAAKKARHTVARVSWNNPDDGYKLNIETYEDPEAIRLYGYRPIDVNAYGCTSRGLARRWGKWIISSDLDSPDTVTYKAGFDHFMKEGQAVRPGDVIRVYDPEISGVQLFGRVTDITDTGSAYEIELDRDVTFPAGVAGTCYIPLPSGEIEELPCGLAIEETKNTITATYASLPTLPAVGATWAIKFNTVEPRQFRVFSVTEPEPNIYQVSATLYDPNKYDKVEQDLNFEPADYTAYPSGEIPAPTSLDTSEFLKQSGASIISAVTLSWVRPDDPRAEFFEVQYQIDGFPWQIPEKNLISETSIDIFNTLVATYNFRVRATDSTGLFKSDWTTLSSVSLLGKTKEPEDVTGFGASIEKFGILLSWNPVTDLDIKHYEIRSGASWATGTIIANVNATDFKYEDLTTGSYTFWIKALDTTGNYSVNEATTIATVSAQNAPTVTAAAVNGGIQLTISGAVARGFKSYEVQRKEYPSGTETTINDNVLTRIWTDVDIGSLGYSSSWQYRVRALDQNGSASAWSSLTTQQTAKKIENDDITANQIIAKDFRTACNAGNGTVSGVLFNANGIQAWNGATNTFCIDAATGNVSMTGTITAAAGSIGGWQISANCIEKVNGENLIRLDSFNNTLYTGRYSGGWCNIVSVGQIYQGAWTGRYGIGIYTASLGNIFEVSDSCKHIAGWNFNANCLYSNNIIIDNSGYLQTADFVSGNKGWKIDCAGNAEFNNICARGAIRTAVFVKDEISVVGGRTLIRPATTLNTDSTFASGSSVFYVDDNAQFAINDIIRIKDGTNDYWGTVTASATGCITASYNSGTTTGDMTKGQAIVNYGSNSGCGGILLDGQCPYIDLYTHTGTPWTGTDSRVRIGNLNGWGADFCAGDYGWVAGCPTGQRAFYTPRTGLCVVGNISSCSGDIGGWSINANSLIDPNSRVYIGKNPGGVGSGLTILDPNGTYTAQLIANCIFSGSTFTCDQGLVLRTSGGSMLMRVTSCASIAGGDCSYIAGWNFTPSYLFSNGIVINSNGGIYTTNFSAGSAGWCIGGGGDAEFNNVTVRGTVCSNTGNIGTFCIYNWAGNVYGLCAPSCFSATCWFRADIFPSYTNGTSTIHGTMQMQGCYNSMFVSSFIGTTCGSSCTNAPIQSHISASTDCFGFYTNGRIAVQSVICASDINKKTDIQRVSVLQYLRQLPITKWRFKDGQNYHIGPMAQDFNSVFKLSSDDKTVYGLDGIALKAAQELDECVQYNNRRILALEEELSYIKSELNKLTCN